MVNLEINSDKLLILWEKYAVLYYVKTFLYPIFASSLLKLTLHMMKKYVNVHEASYTCDMCYQHI